MRGLTTSEVFLEIPEHNRVAAVSIVSRSFSVATDFASTPEPSTLAFPHEQKQTEGVHSNMYEILMSYWGRSRRVA